MKKRFKGFTLIECLIALAILGIASLTMAQIYASVSFRNKNNHLINTSLSNQMAYIEKYEDAESRSYEFNGGTADTEKDATSTTKKPPHISKIDEDKTIKITSSYKFDGTNKGTYSYGTDIFILYSRDRNNHDKDDASYVGETEDNYNLRYKYILGN